MVSGKTGGRIADPAERRRVEQLRKRLAKKVKRGNRGYPLAAVAWYGPDDTRASKMVASIFLFDGDDPEIRKWHSDTLDLRQDPVALAELHDHLVDHGVLSVATLDRIIGCPHEEGIDYEGSTCPRCPFWADRDRWTGEKTR